MGKDPAGLYGKGTAWMAVVRYVVLQYCCALGNPMEQEMAQDTLANGDRRFSNQYRDVD